MYKQISLAELAAKTDAVVLGDEKKVITNFAPLETAGPDDISFLVAARKMVAEECHAGAIFVSRSVHELPGVSATLLQVADPYLAAAITHNFFLEEPFIAKGVHHTAFVGEGSTLGAAVTIAPHATVGERVRIGERVLIESGAVIGDDVQIGDDCVINANVTIYNKCVVGSRVIIHSGTVIGSDGYGYATDERGCHIKRPQVGIVRIEDDVEIGANCTVDRAAYGETVIKSGAKIDNLVQIGHNVVVGENTLLVSQVGIAGSTTLGRNVVMGGQSGAAGHIVIGDQVMVAGRGAVTGNVDAKSVVGGTPAIPVKQWAKCCAVYNKLPELQARIRENSRFIKEIKDEREECNE